MNRITQKKLVSASFYLASDIIALAVMSFLGFVYFHNRKIRYCIKIKLPPEEVHVKWM